MQQIQSQPARPGPRGPLVWILLIGLVAAIIVGACVMPANLASTEESAPAGDAATEPDPTTGGQAAAANSTAAGSTAELLPPSDPPGNITYSSWTTDFTRRTVEWSEIRSGGPPKDGIPAIDAPEFESVEAAGEWLSPRDPVILLRVPQGADAADQVVRAYPQAILMWHEIVNDSVDGRPVSVTFCPLCNASIVFDRNFNGQVLDFGTTGLLRNSDLVMYDRQTETWWQQFTGQGIVGEHAGEHLDFLAAQVVSFADFAAQHPDAEVLARPNNAGSYGMNPYTQYDSTAGRPFLFDGEVDSRLDTMERIVGLAEGDDALAIPFSVAAAAAVIHTDFGDQELVVMHSAGTASALDTQRISEGRDVGSVGVYSRRVDGRLLTFEALAPDAEADAESDTGTSNAATFRDLETGSLWNHLGHSIEGELSGTQLERILAFDHFWFAWAAFFPDTEIYTP